MDPSYLKKLLADSCSKSYDHFSLSKKEIVNQNATRVNSNSLYLSFNEEDLLNSKLFKSEIKQKMRPNEVGNDATLLTYLDIPNAN